MQPEQQNPTPQSNPNVPDFLQLDPIPDPAPSNKKPFVFVVVAIIVAVAAVTAALIAVFMLSKNLTPEERFYKALENSLQTSYVSRKYDSISKMATEGTIESVAAETDLSDPANPKSSFTYKYERPEETGKTGFDIECVVTDKDHYFAVINHDTLGSTLRNVEQGQWYRYNDLTTGRDSITYTLGRSETRLTLNTAQGILPFGNFNDEQRAQLMELIRTENVYVASEYETRTEGDKEFTVYTIKIDYDALNKLNRKITDLLNAKWINLTIKASSSDDEIKLWINSKTNRFERISYILPSDDDFLFKKTIDYDYPSSVTIKPPENVKEL